MVLCFCEVTMNQETIKISIPNDSEGFVLVQCEHCGNFIMVMPQDLKDERLLHLYCPSCGLIIENPWTDDVKELAMTLCNNVLADSLNHFFDKIHSEFNFQGRFISSKASISKIEQRTPNPLFSRVNVLKKVKFRCCKRYAKIKPLLIMTGCYCSFCGVKEYEIK